MAIRSVCPCEVTYSYIKPVSVLLIGADCQACIFKLVALLLLLLLWNQPTTCIRLQHAYLESDGQHVNCNNYYQDMGGRSASDLHCCLLSGTDVFQMRICHRPVGSALHYYNLLFKEATGSGKMHQVDASACRSH